MTLTTLALDVVIFKQLFPPEAVAEPHFIYREWINNLWFSAGLCLVALFGWKLTNIFCKMYRHRLRFKDLKGTDRFGVRVAIPLFVYFLGETIIRGWTWLILVIHNNEKYKEGSMISSLTFLKDWLERDFWVAFTAGCISIWAAICCIYVFSNHTAWIVSALFVLAFFVLNVLYI